MSDPQLEPDQLPALISEMGYQNLLEHVDEVRELVDGLLASYGAVDAFGASMPEVRYPRGEVTTPDPAQNPHNAWIQRVRIEGAAEGPLRGRTIAVKDNIQVAGVPMTSGSDMLAGFVPEVDAEVVTRVLDAGATVTGIATCEYFCFSGNSFSSANGPVHHPLRRGWSPGGSSSGSAVLVRDGSVDMAFGADQAGSIRMPASWTGIVGLKPSWGLVPYTGAAPIAPYFDHVGPMTSTVADNALLLSVIAGPDGIDHRQGGAVVGDYLGQLDRGAAGLRVGVLTEGFARSDSDPQVDAVVRAATADLEKLGAQVVEVSVPEHLVGPALWTPVALDGVHNVMIGGSGWGTLREDVFPVGLMQQLWKARSRAHELPPHFQVLGLAGASAARTRGAAGYAAAVNAIRGLRAAYDAALAEVDVLVMPTTPMAAQPILAPGASIGEQMAAAIQNVGNTCPFDVSHHPALSVPCGQADGLPVGMMIVGRHFDEATVYRLAQAYEARDLA